MAPGMVCMTAGMSTSAPFTATLPVPRTTARDLPIHILDLRDDLAHGDERAGLLPGSKERHAEARGERVNALGEDEGRFCPRW